MLISWRITCALRNLLGVFGCDTLFFLVEVMYNVDLYIDVRCI